MDSKVKVSLEELKSFLDNLRQLANALQEYYDELDSCLNHLHDAWQDEQFDQFETDFQENKEKIIEIRERIESWANQRLATFVDEIENVKQINSFK